MRTLLYKRRVYVTAKTIKRWRPLARPLDSLDSSYRYHYRFQLCDAGIQDTDGLSVVIGNLLHQLNRSFYFVYFHFELKRDCLRHQPRRHKRGFRCLVTTEGGLRAVTDERSQWCPVCG